jgi:hypothetical protein
MNVEHSRKIADLLDSIDNNTIDVVRECKRIADALEQLAGCVSGDRNFWVCNAGP